MSWHDAPIIQPAGGANVPLMPQAQQPITPDQTPNLTAHQQPQQQSQQQAQPAWMGGTPVQPAQQQQQTAPWAKDPIIQPAWMSGTPVQQAAQPEIDMVADAAHRRSALVDVAKSAGVGLAKGAIGIAGLPGDITSLVTGGAHGGGFGSEAIQHGIEGYTGKFYEPQTTAGKYADAIGEFAPAAVLPAGELGIGARLLRMVAAPAIASETAGELTQGTATEPYARMGAAALTGGIGAMTRTPKTIVPAASEVRQAGSDLYQQVTQASNGIPFVQAGRDVLADNIINQLNRTSLRPSVAQQAHDAINEIRDPGQGDLTDLIAARKTLKTIAYEGEGENQAAAKAALPMIDTQIIKSAPQVYPMLKEADADWASALTAQNVEDAVTKGQRRAAKSGTAGNIDNAIRQEVDKATKFATLTPTEQAQADRTVFGDRATNTARMVGRLDPTSGGLSAILHLLATAPTGGANLPFAGAGFVARKIAEARTKSNAAQLSELIRSRSPLAQSISQPAAPQLGLDPWRRALVNAALSRAGLPDQQSQGVPQ
jgi:hypothetical protein